MVAPPITPSPHRFITSKPTHPPIKPSSAFRFQQDASNSSQQFTPAPRFQSGSTQKSTLENATAATQYASPLSRRTYLPGPTPSKAREDIEETGSDDEETNGLEIDEPTFALPTQPSTKRRRPNPPEAVIISSDSPSPLPPPTTPPYPTVEAGDDGNEVVSYGDITTRAARPRFVLPTPKPTDTPSVPSRPPLILPTRSPSPPPKTSAFFSPHRRGQKYVPGGLASTVRDWIVETSQQAHDRVHARRRGGEGSEDCWDGRFRVRDVSVGATYEGMILAQEMNEVRRWMLVGAGRGEISVQVGCTVGVREPTWEVRTGDDLYTVAIEWKVLNG